MKTRLLLIVILFTSCGPGAKLRRAEKLIAKAELEGATWKRDTVFVDRTIHVPGPETRVNVPVPTYRDTVIYKDSVRIEIKWRRGKDGRVDTVEVAAKCPDINIKEHNATVINNEITAPKSTKVAPWWRTAALIGWGIILLVIFLRVIVKAVKSVVP